MNTARFTAYRITDSWICQTQAQGRIEECLQGPEPPPGGNVAWIYNKGLEISIVSAVAAPIRNDPVSQTLRCDL